MSMNAQLEARLSAERAERLRLSRVRDEAIQVIRECRHVVSSVRDATVQQVAGRELAHSWCRLDALEAEAEATPVRCLREANAIANELAQAIESARGKAKAWNAAQIERASQRATIITRMRALEGIDFVRTEAVRGALEADRLAEADALLEQAQEDAASRAQQHAVAQAIVVELKKQGFEVRPSGGGGEALRLVGETPSGRRAEFTIPVDGPMDIELDGYQDRACRRELTNLTAALSTSHGVHTRIPQYEWKTAHPSRVASRRKIAKSRGGSR